jgi:hypothetical protein
MATKRSLAASSRYWKHRALKEDQMAQQYLIARKTLQLSGMKYPCGSVLPAADIPQRTLHATV